MRISDWSSDVCSSDLRAVGPYPAGSITGIEHVLQLLAVMHRGVADDVTPHQLVAPINADMVLVAKVRLSMLLGPARILVFLSFLSRFLLPLKLGLSRLFCRIILPLFPLSLPFHLFPFNFL